MTSYNLLHTARRGFNARTCGARARRRGRTQLLKLGVGDGLTARPKWPSQTGFFEIELYVINGFFGVQCEYNDRMEDKIKLNIEQISFNRKTRST